MKKIVKMVCNLFLFIFVCSIPISCGSLYNYYLYPENGLIGGFKLMFEGEKKEEEMAQRILTEAEYQQIYQYSELYKKLKAKCEQECPEMDLSSFKEKQIEFFLD